MNSYRSSATNIKTNTNGVSTPARNSSCCIKLGAGLFTTASGSLHQEKNSPAHEQKQKSRVGQKLAGVASMLDLSYGLNSFMYPSFEA